MNFNDILVAIDDFVWGVPLMVLIIAGGLLLTCRTKLVQVFHLPLALKWMVQEEENGKGNVSSFGALCTALSATIGTGNIVGVTTAICAGGPGALFWMLVAAFLGMATKYAEGFLAVKFRVFDKNGQVLGGPFYYIEKGMGTKWKWLAKTFAVFGVCAGLMGIGTFTQVNGISSAIHSFFDAENAHTVDIPLIGEYSWSVVIASIFLAVVVGLVIIGGIQRISSVATVVVPFMAVAYVVFGILVIFSNLDKLPMAIELIVKGAFNPSAVTGGVVGTMFIAMQKGVARGIFSNESGLGSAPIASAAAKTNSPVRQGLVAMTGTFLDTIVICTMTGLAVILTGAWQVEGIEGVDVTSYAFGAGIPFLPEKVTSFILMISLVFFAFTTIIGWDYYSESCLEYLTKGNKKVVKVFRYLYILAVFIGPYMTISAVWTIADIFNGLMAIPNMIALFALSGIVAKDTKEFFQKRKAEKKNK